MLTTTVLLATMVSTSGFDTEVISDLVSPVSDERRAMEIKNDQFWQAIQQAAKDTHVDEHLLVYAEVEAAVDAMPADNVHVRGLLTEALGLLRRVDEVVLEQAVQSSDLASEKLAQGVPSEGAFSFLKGGQNFFSVMIKRFVGGGQYSESVAKHVADRQADILPALRGAASVSGNVLTDCRMASKLGFDALKYDIYNKGVPKTPEPAKAAAYRLIDAVGQTRRQFMSGIVSMANAIAKDTEEKDVDPSAKVTQSLLGDLTPFGSKTEGQGNGFNIASEERVVIRDMKGLNF